MCINCAKKEQKMGFSRVFCLFLDFGHSDWPDIAYDGSAKCYSTCGHGYRSYLITYACIMCINCAKRARNEVFGHFLEFGASDWLDNAYFDRTVWFARFDHRISHAGSFKITKMPFWMIQIAKNEVFSHFLDFNSSDWLDIAYFDLTKWFARFGHRISHAGSFKNQKNAFLNDQITQK